MKKFSLLLLTGILSLGTVQPAMAHRSHGHYHDHNRDLSTAETIIGIGLIGAGIWWNYGPEIEYNYDGDTYILCNDHGRRYYC